MCWEAAKDVSWAGNIWWKGPLIVQFLLVGYSWGVQAGAGGTWGVTRDRGALGETALVHRGKWIGVGGYISGRRGQNCILLL